MNIIATPIAGLVVVESDVSRDERGTFSRLYCGPALESVTGSRRIVQINHSLTRSVGTVRGLHYQRQPHAEMKLVRCLRGRVWDVAVDLRRDSDTFLDWHAEELSDGNRRMLVIPEGFAHGFQALEDDSELLYLHTAAYVPEAEDGIGASDPRLNIDWPLGIEQLSRRDHGHPLLTDDFNGLVV